MSYVLFSQTSGANGTRNLWTNAHTAESGGSNAAVVGGVVTTVANSTFDVGAVVAGFVGIDHTTTDNTVSGFSDGVMIRNGQRALFSLGDADGDALNGYTFNNALGNDLAVGAIGNVLNAALGQTIEGTASNRTLDENSGFVNGALNLGMADVNWNDIKNVEVYIASAETGDAITSLTLRSFVDTRIKLGNEDGCRDIIDFRTIEERILDSENYTGENPADRPDDGRFDVSIVDGKRGQIEGSEADVALNATIDVWTNDAGWQNSFSNTGSAFSDKFDINFGQLSVVRNVSEFGTGAGRLVDANDTTYGIDLDQTSAYNGHLTTLFTNTGAGNDVYDATSGVRVVAIKNSSGATIGTKIEEAELLTTDYAWGGSGNDTIKGGGGNDFLFGDFGAVGSTGISQMADPTLTKLFIGGSGNPIDWVSGTGVKLTAFNGSNSQPTVFEDTPADLANAAKRAVFDPTVHQEPSGQFLGLNPAQPAYLGGDRTLRDVLDPADDSNDPTTPATDALRAATTGLGVDTIIRDEFTTGTEHNNEINAGPTDGDGGNTTEPANARVDTLTVALDRLASAIDGRLTRFYGDEALVRIGNRDDEFGTNPWGSETAVVRFGVDGSVNGVRNGVIDDGEMVGSIRFSAVTFDAAVATSGIVTGFRGQAIDPSNNASTAGAQRPSNNDGGWFDFAIETSGAFDLIEFSSGGYVLVDTSKANPFDPIVDLDSRGGGDVSDFRLRELCFTLAQVEGNDVLEAGTGRDLLNGGGDLATVVLCAVKGAEVLVNGGFETLALVRDVRESGNWYLTDGNINGSDPNFGWTVSVAASENIEIQRNGTGGLVAINDDGAGHSFKLELDSHSSAGQSPTTLQARPLVSQTVKTCDGGIYELAFAFAERRDNNLGIGSSDFELSWDGAVVATFTKAANATSWTVTDANMADGITANITVNSNTGWATAKVTGLVGDGSDAVAFQSVAGQTTTYGAFIDSVSLKATYNSYVVTGGDRLNPGLDNDRDTIEFRRGDGFDIVTGFDARAGSVAAEDEIRLIGLSVDKNEVAVVNGQLGILLTFTDGDATNGDDGRMFIAGVTDYSLINISII